MIESDDETDIDEHLLQELFSAMVAGQIGLLVRWSDPALVRRSFERVIATREDLEPSSPFTLGKEIRTDGEHTHDRLTHERCDTLVVQFIRSLILYFMPWMTSGDVMWELERQVADDVRWALFEKMAGMLSNVKGAPR
jgi:hypothetical protein